MVFADVELNDGNKIPAIAYGSGSVNRGKDISQYIGQAIEVGFSHLDTAQFYQNEDSVGKAIRDSGLAREDLYVTTKWGHDKVEDAFSASLQNLGLEYVDLYLIHVPWVIEDGDFEGAWRKYEKLKEDGLAKSIGVSNFGIGDLQKIIKIAKFKPAVNQIRFHPYNYKETKALLEYQAKHGILTEAYGSLAPLTTYPGGPLDPVLQKIATKRGIAISQVIFLWVKAKGAIIVTTSSKKEHLEEYIAVGDLDDLTVEEVEEIDTASAKFVEPKLQMGHSLTVKRALLLVAACVLGGCLWKYVSNRI